MKFANHENQGGIITVKRIKPEEVESRNCINGLDGSYLTKISIPKNTGPIQEISANVNERLDDGNDFLQCIMENVDGELAYRFYHFTKDLNFVESKAILLKDLLDEFKNPTEGGFLDQYKHMPVYNIELVEGKRADVYNAITINSCVKELHDLLTDTITRDADCFSATLRFRDAQGFANAVLRELAPLLEDYL